MKNSDQVTGEAEKTQAMEDERLTDKKGTKQGLPNNVEAAFNEGKTHLQMRALMRNHAE